MSIYVSIVNKLSKKDVEDNDSNMVDVFKGVCELTKAEVLEETAQ